MKPPQKQHIHHIIFICLLMVVGWGQDCDENMYWSDCGLPFGCNPTCLNPIPPDGCITLCEVGCFCNPGFIFSDDSFNECILIENCPESSLCNEETEVELWGECYNIETTTFINLSYQEGSDYPPLSGEIPSEIGQLVNMTDLYLGGNELTIIPPEIGDLINLESLFLYGNTFISIPSEIGNLTNLVTLDIGYNQIIEIPDELILLDNLEVLRLEHNHLTSLPDDLCNLSDCFIYVNDNQLCEEYNYDCFSDDTFFWEPQNQLDCEEFQLGDVNQDNELNVVDIVLMVNCILDNNCEYNTSDINEDGITNVVDIVLLVNTILEN